MSENKNAIEFTITTSRDQLVDKTIEEIKKHTYLDPLFDAAFKGNFPPDLTKEERAEREIHRYEVPPTYAIWICDFPIGKQKEFRGDWAVRNKKGLTLSDKMMYILYDLTKFNKPYEKIETAEDRWLYLLKHAGNAENLPDFDDSVIAKAIHRILVDKASEKLIKDQANDMVWTEEELDRWALLEVRAEQKAIAKGHKQGLEQGLEQGLIQGLEQGRVEMALAMLADNEPIEKIVKYSHLPESKILELKASSSNEAIK
ncbi:MAG: hypothetical protein IJM92_13655 [Fibrobacter sp.]|uniref:PD-(D/E)XK nuclease family transposase n=1 Tax=Fibrobacter sp. TaxID=35828 RepID=UPI0025BC41D4|nr:PD-(D/E)XK nuclease family transposase [Fibrobacter sp.]MBQ7080670.1 hypothetical protein [Fibrobacter sp.]